ncbi:PREDICTED: protein GLUTAMINE DUMPER 5 [Nelumbo nucifera]|uniref:Protein GLUTAMINE DUMPER 5 n=2 Tax=Nelumbo nucifera TaxID=4432 RepID=A0A1U8ADC5_NELNU|nr:PREDICTED: protein GLUTAMINE DUMPER 5 [Nelumbo nucifera]DAD27625.1 TPA_asm: hypothetical protein HUJ06_029093 [Nelumbo nucifera]
MRTGGTFGTTTTVATGSTATAAAPASAAAAAGQHSPWHSPVPYLFGGLAAMLGLIAFALLILACSYWKLSGQMEGGEGSERDPENGNDKAGEAMKIPTAFEEKILVIMAGDEKPTFLATPISSKASAFGDNSKNKDDNNRITPDSEKPENTEKAKASNQDENQEENQDQERANRETQEQSQ